MLIDNIIDTIKHTRRNFLELVATCSTEEMNVMPEGFRNNLAWNLAHVVSSQQVLCYELSNVDPRVDMAFIDAYRPGTAPVAPIAEQEIARIRDYAVSTVPQLVEDYHAGIFTTYVARQTKFGVLISDIDQAIAYVSTHETLHFGYAKALLRTIRVRTPY
jgi:hypothetical protein